MEFSPASSKIFGAAAFANFYSSLPLVAARILFAIFLMVILSGTSGGRLFYLVGALAIIFVVFEIFYREKISREKPVSLDKTKNLADSLSLEAARLLVKTRNPADPNSLLKILVKNKKVLFFLKRADIAREELKNLFAATSTPIDLNTILTAAASWAQKENRGFLDKLDIMMALIDQNPTFKNLLFEKNLKEPDFLNVVFWTRSVFDQDQVAFWEKPVETLGPGISEVWLGGWTPQTEQYTFDITKQLRKEKVNPVLVGRDQEIKAVEEILSRAEKRNAILLGPPGSGKTAIIYSLAAKSTRGQLPQELKYKRFLQLDPTTLLAGAAAGGLEERLLNLLTELSHADNVVLYIPDIETLTGAGGGVDITGHLLNTLASGRLQTLATSTRQAYRRHIESSASFAALFETIDVEEPTREETIRILEETSAKIERKHKLAVSYKALARVVELAQNYVVDKVLPGKAIDLLDEVAAHCALNKNPLMEVSDVETVISQKTKSPVRKAVGQEAQQLLNLENILHQRIVDQNEAITSISNALRRARTIERQSRKPIGSFLFLGPTGVGKTETAKALAALYFGSEEKIIRVDMSEYQTADSINRLIGAPTGAGRYEEGGQFSESVRQNPYSLLLLDEIEKAHPKIQEAFLPVFDEGVLADATGRKIIFTNCLIIATSNAGAEFIRESIQQQSSLENIKKELLEKLQREGVFKPEFLNRFDDIVAYKPLNESEVVAVVGLLINELAARLNKQDIALAVDPSVLTWVAKAGYDPTYGARPLRRFIADNIEEKIAEKILSGELKRGSQVQTFIQNGQLGFTSS